jgi:hypothetical protein
MIDITCGDAERLRATYKAALTAYDYIQSPLAAALVPEYITANEALQAKEEAFLALIEARRQYWNHTQAHRCRKALLGSKRHLALSA